jgi:hypothetical protein
MAAFLGEVSGFRNSEFIAHSLKPKKLYDKMHRRGKDLAQV